MSRYGPLLALLAVVLSLVCSGAAVAEGAPCPAAPVIPATELVYSPQPGEKAVTAQTRGEAAATLCARLQSSKIAGRVSVADDGRIHVVLPALPHPDDLQRVAGQLSASGLLRFYDWEPNLIGLERVIGGHPGFAPPAKALRRLEQKWKAARRPLGEQENAQLIFAGALPNPYGAVNLASKQAPRKCRACTASGPRFYLFDRSPTHKLIAGPVARRAELEQAKGGAHQGGLVLKVPVGTVIAFEFPSNSEGVVLRDSEPGWFALKDRAALTNADVVRPKQELDEFGQPNITFGFTRKGRAAFERVTRAIAKRGEASAKGPVTAAAAEAFSGHFALVFDGEVKTRPIINFAENPKGIDGRAGAQISGGFNSTQEARDLATILREDPLPIVLELAEERKLGG